MGFGGAALLATPLADRLMHAFRVAPTYLGAQGEVPLVFRDGKRFATLADGTQVEAVVATMTDLLRMSFTSLPEGVYQVGTGSTGAGMANQPPSRALRVCGHRLRRHASQLPRWAYSGRRTLRCWRRRQWRFA